MMMVLEGRKLPLTFYVLDSMEAPACGVADKCFEPKDYRSLVDAADVVTFEFEHVPEEALEYAEERGKLVPRLSVVALKRERWRERELYRRLDLPTPRFFIVEGAEEALKLVRDEFNYRAVIKESRGGYDGRGQHFIRTASDVERVREALKKVNDVLVVEEFVDFDYEASVVAVRDFRGRFASYPPTYNYNERGILVYNYGPLPDAEVGARMVSFAQKLAEALNYVGVLAVEFFVRDGEVLINELAPRVHNTGHYTLDAAFISQFEQHIRAVVGVEAGETSLMSCGGMVNILGLEPSRVPLEILKYGKVYWYGKREVRRRRKMGHVNVVGGSLEEVKSKVEAVMRLLYPSGPEL